MYTKRQTIAKFWPVPRKGTKYLSTASHEKQKAIPLVVLMREALKLVKSKKELKMILNNKGIEINNKVVKEPNFPVSLFDTVSMPSIKKYYQAVLVGKRFNLKEIDEKQSLLRTYKVINKKQISKDKEQINLNSGKNILLGPKDKKIIVGSFVVLNTKENNIVKTIALDKGIEVLVISGRHIGKQGKIVEITKQGQNNIVKITLGKEEEINVGIENLFAI
jgi:small subunit ribosomal protein S4e